MIVFIGLHVWRYLSGRIDAILAVPMTMLMLIIMVNSEGTRPLAILMRYTGEVNKKERKDATRHMKDSRWGR